MEDSNTIKEIAALTESIVEGLTYAKTTGKAFDHEDGLNEAAEELFNLVADCEEDDLFAFVEDLGDLIVALFWHYDGWHGNINSTTYRLLCLVSGLYTPGCSETGPEYGSMAAIFLTECARLAGYELFLVTWANARSDR